MTADLRSPRILQLSCGRVEIEGRGTFKDAKIYPGGARAWGWRETGTRHVLGIQPADVAELLAHGAAVVVLSQACWSAFRSVPRRSPCSSAGAFPPRSCRPRRPSACANELAAAHKAGGVFRSTC